MESKKSLIVAIDGYSSCGKSTIAKDLAKELGYAFIDSGAMYRAVSYYFIENNIKATSKPENLNEILKGIHIHFANVDGINTIFLNDKALTSEIRSKAVSSIVSEVAAMSEVRAKLVALQQSYGATGGLVMDGRDIGTVVFPDADLKFFVTADIDVRSQRRFDEVKNTVNAITLDQVKENLSHRDHIDSTREDSPLTQAPDATIIDTTHHTRESQVEEVKTYVAKLLKGN